MKNKFFVTNVLTIILFFVKKIIFINAYNINDTINYVFKNNKKIQITKKNLELAILEKYKLVTEYFPDINIETGNNWYKLHNLYLINNLSDITVKQYSFFLNIEQEIFTGGTTILKFIVINNEINNIYQEYNKLLNDIISKCIQYYQNIISIRKILKIQKENILIARKILQKTLNAKDTEEINHSIILIKLNLHNIQSNFKNLLKQHKEIEGVFQYYTERGLPRRVQKVNSLFFRDITKNNRKYKINSYKKNNELNILKNNLKNNRYINRINICHVLPKITLFANQSLNIKRSNSFLKDRKRLLYENWGIKIFFPIFSKGGVQYFNIKEGKRKNIQSKYIVKDISKILKNKMDSLWEIYINKRSIYKISCEIEKTYYKIYLNYKLGFFAGSKNLAEVLNKKKDYNDAHILKIKRENSYFLSLIQIYNFKGELITKI